MTAVATYLQSAKPIITEVPGSAPIILEIMKFGLSAFKGADYMEGLFDQLIEQALKADSEGGGAEEDPEAAKTQADIAKIGVKKQADIEVATAKHQQEPGR
jgi:hypothetical protein